MVTFKHPLKGEFNDNTARLERLPHNDDTPASLEIGYGGNGLVALRKADDPNSTVLIYTPEEWEAFVIGVRDGEFDLDTWD
ncbi:DUF397 domain-containing protein [Haloglycomyces albus]|uniref:DUF397 domain-containing protein n=1 Tax=Haloglycomyces albus TaxID=526067 RepID=UPI00046D3953|nr:DUF397 domain-containing protein [Haloglycomyces albus]